MWLVIAGIRFLWMIGSGNQNTISQAHGFDPYVTFAPRGTHLGWVSDDSVLLRKVHGIPSPLNLLHQWCHLEALNPGHTLALKGAEVSTILKLVFIFSDISLYLFYI